MIKVAELISYLDKLLTPENFQDYCPNGLQVEGKKKVNKIITGVTACQSLLDIAVSEKADAVLVHHGYFWKEEKPCIIGMKHKRIATLIDHDINLIAYHLPLDAHPTCGNNVQLAKILNIEIDTAQEKDSLVLTGKLKTTMLPDAFISHISSRLDRKPLYIPGASKTIKTIAWCTGGAQDFIEQAANLKVDAYLTGEVSERTVHIAREMGVHFFSAGHHATERYGIKFLGEHLAAEFGLECKFIDIDNPV
jgi:dinuclear metal center YbgI/SA1388 family protein